MTSATAGSSTWRDGVAEFLVTTDDDLFAAPALLGVQVVYPAEFVRRLSERGFNA